MSINPSSVIYPQWVPGDSSLSRGGPWGGLVPRACLRPTPGPPPSVKCLELLSDSVTLTFPWNWLKCCLGGSSVWQGSPAEIPSSLTHYLAGKLIKHFYQSETLSDRICVILPHKILLCCHIPGTSLRFRELSTDMFLSRSSWNLTEFILCSSYQWNTTPAWWVHTWKAVLFSSGSPNVLLL